MRHPILYCIYCVVPCGVVQNYTRKPSHWWEKNSEIINYNYKTLLISCLNVGYTLQNKSVSLP